MENKEFRKSLFQCAIVLGIILIFIGFVAGSDANSFWGGLFSIIKGIFTSILFVIGLTFSLIFSVCVLISVFLGAVAMYSRDDAADIFAAIKRRLAELRGCCCPSAQCNSKESLEEEKAVSEKLSEQTPEDSSSILTAKEDDQEDAKEVEPAISSAEFANISSSIEKLQDQSTNIESSVTKLISDVKGDTDSISKKQEELSATLVESSETLTKLQSELQESKEQANKQQEVIVKLQGEVKTLKSALDTLKKNEIEDTGTGEAESHRILTYLEKKKDQNLFIKAVEEGVAQKMTYAEIDEFLTKSLPKKIDTIIKDHPTLTKDFIRECKKN